MTRILHLLFALILSLTATHLALGQTSNTTEAGVGNGSVSDKDKSLTSSNAVIADPLVRMLIAKGVLTENEGHLISESGNAVEQRDRLANLLRDKGIISAAEYEAVRTVVPIADAVALNASSRSEVADNSGREQPSTPQAAPTPSVIAAVAPTRLLPIDSPKREGLIPDIKLGPRAGGILVAHSASCGTEM